MRFGTAFILLALIVLAACNTGSPAPTATTGADQTPLTDAGTPLVVPTLPPEATIALQQRENITSEAPLPIPGTLSAPATEDPMTGQPYDRIAFTQSGGITGRTINVEILADGTVNRDGTTVTIGQDQLSEIYAMLDRLNLFGMQGVFTAPGAGADITNYSLTIERAGASRTIDAQDGFVPDQLMALFTVLGALGASQ